MYRRRKATTDCPQLRLTNQGQSRESSLRTSEASSTPGDDAVAYEQGAMVRERVRRRALEDFTDAFVSRLTSRFQEPVSIMRVSMADSESFFGQVLIGDRTLAFVSDGDRDSVFTNL